MKSIMYIFILIHYGDLIIRELFFILDGLQEVVVVKLCMNTSEFRL